MAQEKRKVESYQNFGGINSKASQYVTGPTEFLDLRNMDFQTPGALTSRWGSTQYIGPTYGASVPIQSLFEFEQLSGFSQIIFSFSGSILAGATTGAHQGISFTNIGATIIFKTHPQRWIEYKGTPTDNFISPTDKYSSYFWHADNTVSSTVIVNPEVLGKNKSDYVNFVNNCFQASSSSFFKYNGETTSKLSLLTPSIDGASVILATGTSTYLPIWNEYYAALSYVNNRGFQSHVTPVFGPLRLNFDLNGATLQGSALKAGGFGDSLAQIWLRVNTPLAYGISSVNVWIYQTPGVASPLAAQGVSLYGLPFRFFKSVAASGTSFLDISIGTTLGGESFIMEGALPDVNSYISLGERPRSTSIQAATLTIVDALSPQYLELYSNRLFYSGSTLAQSTVYYSEVGEPEGYQADWTFEVRTNDGDVVQAMKAYNSRLYIFKDNSFHELSGDSPETFVLREMSDQYGCLSNRATVTFDNRMMFLDKKGICEFNGANTKIESNKLQPIFDRMNIVAARGNATAIHDRQRNQVLFGIPVDGSATNNFTIVYDYLVNAWTTHDGYNPSVFAMVKGSRGVKTPMIGNNSGQIMFFGPSLMSDMGTTGAAAFTCIIKSRMLAEAGNSVQKQYRRLFLDTNVSGTTSAITVKFMQDHGASVVLTRTMYKDKFQNRIDYGLSARALALQIESADASNPLTLSGFTIEYRIQRMV